jgi:hypothetical protein
MSLKKMFSILFCFFSILSSTEGAAPSKDVDMWVPRPHLIAVGAAGPVGVRVQQVTNDHGPKSALFSVFRDSGEYDIDKGHFDAPPGTRWGLQTSTGFSLLEKDESDLHSWKLRAFATCQFVGIMWEDYCDNLLELYAQQKPPRIPVFRSSLEKARENALTSPVQIFCSHSCYDEEDGEDKECPFNAHYTRNHEGRGKGIFFPRYDTSCGSRHTTGSFFTMAHEAGHSILDRFCPAYQDHIIKDNVRGINGFINSFKDILGLEVGEDIGDIDGRLQTFDPELWKRGKWEEYLGKKERKQIEDYLFYRDQYLSYKALDEAFGDITAILGSLKVDTDPGALIRRLDPYTCFLEIECGGCDRGKDTPVDNPFNYHGRSLLLTRTFCNLLKKELLSPGADGVSAMRRAARRFLNLVLIKGNSMETTIDPFTEVEEKLLS